MRHCILLAVIVTALAPSPVFAGGKGRGGGQGHASRPHPSSAARPHPQTFSPPRPHPQNAAKPHAATPPKSQAMVNSVVPHAAQGSAAQLSPSNSLSTSSPAGSTAQKPLASTAPSSTPVLLYGSLTPFASQPGLSLYHGYHAYRNYYGSGYGRGRRGYGYRNSSMVSARMRHLARLVRDLNTLTVGYAASPAERNILRSDLMAVAQGGYRPPPPAVFQLSGDLITHLPRRQIRLLNTEQLALDLEAVMNGSRLSPARVNQAISSAQLILRASGVPQAGIQALSTDLRSIGFWRMAGNQAGLVR
jgi:hypothetical protein